MYVCTSPGPWPRGGIEFEEFMVKIVVEGEDKKDDKDEDEDENEKTAAKYRMQWAAMNQPGS